MARDLTPDELDAIKAFAAAHGRRWKSQLTDVYWYNARIWNGRNELHALRNDPRFGHAGLESFKLPKAESAMFLEYDWTLEVYRPRFGQTFTDWRGYRSFESLDEAKAILAQSGCKLGRKTDTRTWQIVSKEES